MRREIDREVSDVCDDDVHSRKVALICLVLINVDLDRNFPKAIKPNGLCYE